MTTATRLDIGDTGTIAALDCGHVLLIDRMTSPPRPGTPVNCPTCLWEQFNPVERGRLRFWRWLRLTGRAGA